MYKYNNKKKIAMHMQHKSQYTQYFFILLYCYIKPFFVHNKYYFPMLKLTNH